MFGTKRQASSIAAEQIGRLTRNTDPQPNCSTRSPPASGPSAIPMPETPAQIPIAIARSAGSRNVLVRIDSVVGKMNAPPIPMSPLAPMSCVGVLTVEASADDTPNQVRPNMSG